MLSNDKVQEVHAAELGSAVVINPKLAVMFVTVKKANEMGFDCRDGEFTYLESTGKKATPANGGKHSFSSLSAAKRHFLNFVSLKV